LSFEQVFSIQVQLSRHGQQVHFLLSAPLTFAAPSLDDIDDEDDPIVAEYDVYITPESDEHIYLLQYPNRERGRPYNEENKSAPTELRIKPKTGFLEVDVDFGIYHHYFDRTKGVTWGDSVDTAKESGLNAFGVASGFGKGGRTNDLFAAGAQRRPADEATIDNMVAEFEDTADKGSVLDKQTFGGQIIRPEERQPTYMLGAFRGSESDALIPSQS
jgi:DNA-directed RNA polymerase-3 subunit RPC5